MGKPVVYLHKKSDRLTSPAEGPGRKWVSDITCLRVLGGWLYLTVVLDLFDRKVVG